MQGFLNLNKPAGLTSHDCVSRVRRLLRLKRVGHGGTLDPAATGVLPIAIDRATRLLQFLSHEKAYRATIRFGVTTATDDLAGEVLTCQSVPWLKLDAIEAVLPNFLGKIEQIPPRYSAIQVQGKRLYDLARAGEAIEVPTRSVEVHDIKILAWRSGDLPELDVAIACGSGTYIRSIARDVGEVLQTGGTLAALVRTQSSGLHLEDSLTLEALAAQVDRGEFETIAPDSILHHLPCLTLAADIAYRWCQGQRIFSADATQPLGICRIYREDKFLGIGDQRALPDGLLLSPQVVFSLSPQPAATPLHSNESG